MRSGFNRLLSATALSCVSALTFAPLAATAETVSRASVAGAYVGAFASKFHGTEVRYNPADAEIWEDWETGGGYREPKSQEYGLEFGQGDRGDLGAGVTVGYNWVDPSEKFVLGVEADYLAGRHDGVGGLTTLRARAGVLLGQVRPTLVYATAGRATAEISPLNYARDMDYVNALGASDRSHGTVLGVGVEHWLSAKGSVKIELRKLSFDDVQSVTVADVFDWENQASTTTSADWRGQQLIIGYNYKF